MTTDKTIGEDTSNVHVYDVNADGKTYRVLAVDAYTAERKGKLLYQLECKKSPRDVAARMVSRVKQVETPPIPLADLWKYEQEDDMPEHPAFSNPDAEALAKALLDIATAGERYNVQWDAATMGNVARSALTVYRAKHPKDTR